ncbi:MAG TPA: hypothetical protein VKV80_20000 [Streptosporangiaceae bacterium]|nr:hypothetical protein [Streptosporangiaceae bacterium]
MYDPAANTAEMWNMCVRATARADAYCNQVLRATIDCELHHGPDFRVTVGPGSGGRYPVPYWGASAAQNARIIAYNWPVLQVLSVRVCPGNLWPRSWTDVPAGFFEPEQPPVSLTGTVTPTAAGQGGQAILVGGGYINWSMGRNGWAIEVTYVNGWPHASVTAAAAAGDTSLAVDDCTGWALASYQGTSTGATGVIKDSGQQEAVHVTAASAVSGPGTLTLSSPLAYPHQAGTLVTTLPGSVEQACIWFAAAEALTRGATSTTIHAVGGSVQSSDKSAQALAEEAELLIHPLRRTV